MADGGSRRGVRGVHPRHLRPGLGVARGRWPTRGAGGGVSRQAASGGRALRVVAARNGVAGKSRTGKKVDDGGTVTRAGSARCGGGCGPLSWSGGGVARPERKSRAGGERPPCEGERGTTPADR